MNHKQRPTPARDKIRVYYDASCPICRRDRRRYDQLAGKEAIDWCDITDNDAQLKAEGIDPEEAMIKLHVQKPNGEITSDIEAYILLFSEIRWLKPIAWLLNVGWIKERVRALYRWWVTRRLVKEGRLSKRPKHR